MKAVGFDVSEFNSHYAQSWDYTNALKQLKRLGYSAKEIKALNHDISALKGAGFDEVKDIKPLFAIRDFYSLYSQSWNYINAAKELKRLGYSADEIKAVGYSSKDLKSVGF